MDKKNKKGKGKKDTGPDDFGPALGAPKNQKKAKNPATPQQAAASAAPTAGAWARPVAPNVPRGAPSTSSAPTSAWPRPAAPSAPQPAASTAPSGAWARPAAPGAPATSAWGQNQPRAAQPQPSAAAPVRQSAPGPSRQPAPGPSRQPVPGPSRQPAPGSSAEPSAAAPVQADRPNSAAGGRADIGGNGEKIRGRLRPTRERPEHLEVVKTKPETVNKKQGSSGKTVQLLTNHFKLFSKLQWEILHYRVDFEPQVEYGKALMFRLKQMQTIPLGGYLFDGSSLFVTRRLHTQNQPIVLTMQNNDGQPIQVTIKWVGIVSNNESQFVQILNIIMKHAMTALNLERVGRDYFDPGARIAIQRYGIELWPGYTTSIRQHEQDILMLAEIKHKMVRGETIFSIINDIYFAHKNAFKNEVDRILLGMTVLTRYNNKTYRVSEVNFDMKPSNTFEGRNGEQIRYIDYYRTKYNINIMHPDQPMLICKPKDRDLRGGVKEIALVPELCLPTGYTDQMRGNFALMRDVAQYTRVEPSGRIQKLLAFNQRVQSTPDSVAQLNNWHLNLEPNLLRLTGRTLPPQEIKFNGQIERYPTVNWQQAFRDHKMYASAKLDLWFYVYPQRNEREARSFRDCLLRAAAGMRFAISEPKMVAIPDDRIQTLNTHIEECCRQNPRLILTLLTSSAADKYTNIKRRCYILRGVASQVVLVKTIADPKKAMSVATKVAIQINAKLGGAPWMIGIPAQSLMTIGYDVYHDSTDKSRSFGALVATMDLTDQTKSPGFFSTVSPHTNGEELSNNFAVMVLKALRAYQARHGRIPGSIIVYRDGVGEGQTNYVYEHELKHLVASLKEFYKEKPLKMAFVIVSKRINTKFFTADQRNPPAGTVVDDVVTLPERYDFFLVSQNVNQGTATPTNYNILYDTLGIPPDKMQEFTYRMCHLYYNWSGTTRVPAPCQYAHKLAFLVGQYLHSAPNAQLEQTLYFL